MKNNEVKGVNINLSMKEGNLLSVHEYEEITLVNLEDFLDEVSLNFGTNFNKWKKNYLTLVDYYKVNGHSDVPLSYKINDINLGSWVNRQRKEYKNGGLDGVKIALLGAVSFKFDLYLAAWLEKYNLLSDYYKANNHSDVPKDYEVDGQNLGGWVDLQRQEFKKGKLDIKRIELLEKLDFKFDLLMDAWEETYLLLEEYYDKHEHSNVPVGYKINGKDLGAWANRQRAAYKKGTLNEKQIKSLEKLNFKFILKSGNKKSWMEMYTLLVQYYNENGHSKVPHRYEINGDKLGYWVSTLRKDYKNGKLDKEQIQLLKNVDFQWEIRKTK